MQLFAGIFYISSNSVSCVVYKKCPTSLIQLKPPYKVYQHQLSYHYWQHNFRAYTEIRQQQLNRQQVDNIRL